MKDLTQGPITRHLIGLAAPIAIGMLFQTLYVLVDLVFVSRLGDAAIAGVTTAATAAFVILALTQTLSVGTVALVAQAVGRKDQPGAEPSEHASPPCLPRQSAGAGGKDQLERTGAQ